MNRQEYMESQRRIAAEMAKANPDAAQRFLDKAWLRMQIERSAYKPQHEEVVHGGEERGN